MNCKGDMPEREFKTNVNIWIFLFTTAVVKYDFGCYLHTFLNQLPK